MSVNNDFAEMACSTQSLTRVHRTVIFAARHQCHWLCPTSRWSDSAHGPELSGDSAGLVNYDAHVVCQHVADLLSGPISDSSPTWAFSLQHNRCRLKQWCADHDRLSWSIASYDDRWVCLEHIYCRKSLFPNFLKHPTHWSWEWLHVVTGKCAKYLSWLSQ